MKLHAVLGAVKEAGLNDRPKIDEHPNAEKKEPLKGRFL